MYSVSDRFLQAIKGSGQRRTVVDLYYDNYMVMADVEIVSGTINIDRASRNRRSGSLKFADPTLFPTILRSTGLSPYGVEARIRSGVFFPNRTEELVPLGTFLVYSSEGQLTEGFVPDVQLYDRAQRVYETSSWSAGDSGFNFGGKLVSEAIHQLVMYAAPYWPSPVWSFDFSSALDTSDRLVPDGQYAGATDRWQLVQDLSLSIGAETYFDINGDCKVVPIKYLPFWTPVQSVEWTVNDSLISAVMKTTRENTYNSVIVVGSSKESDSVPPFYVAHDDDPRSKTYWNGFFGKKTLRIEDSTLTTVSECASVAIDKLALLCGLSESISFECLQNPASDVGDIINVPLNGEDNVLMIESIDLPLHKGTMSVQTRSIQYVKG